MSAQTQEFTTPVSWLGGVDQAAAAVPRRRLRGLRAPVLPSGPLLAQLLGGVGALVGLYVEFGSAVTLIAGGITSVVLGALREGGRI